MPNRKHLITSTFLFVGLLVGTYACANADADAPIGLPLNDTSNDQYRAAVAAVENNHGAHDFAIVEPAIGLGLNLQQQNQHADAITALKRALHVNRINRGLHDLDHVPIIDLITHSHMTLGDWAGAEQQQMLRFWIHEREVETAEELSVEALNAYADAAVHFSNWQAQSYARDTGRFPLVKLRHAQSALSDARQRFIQQNRTVDARYFALLNTIAVNNYNIVIYLSNNEVDAVSGSAAVDQDMSDYLLRQNIIVDSFRNGTAALREVIELTNTGDPGVQHAQAILNYADWQLLFNRPQTASKEYARAFSAFQNAGIDKAELNQRFAEPERISAFRLQPGFHENANTSEDDKVSEQPADAAYVLAVFDVNRHGQVRNLDIEKSWPENDRRLRRAARSRLVASKFRPALIDGKPVVRKDVKIRYLFSSYDRPDSSP